LPESSRGSLIRPFKPVIKRDGNGTLTLKGLLGAPAGIQLQRATFTLSSVLDESSGAGELVRQDSGAQLDLPLVLPVINGSTAHDAVYATPRGTTPRVQVEIRTPKHPAGRSKFQIMVDLAEIDSPLHAPASRSSRNYKNGWSPMTGRIPQQCLMGISVGGATAVAG
jgi:hypothetical protein